MSNFRDKIILITGSSGFIGANLCERLLKENPETKIIGIDNMNGYYDVHLKEYRLSKLKVYQNFEFILGDIADSELIHNIFL